MLIISAIDALMKILAINCGSSTLKFQLIQVEGEGIGPGQRRLASGIVDRIGGQGTLRFTAEKGESVQEAATVADHGEATRLVLQWLESGAALGAAGFEAVGHRVVHGGDRFVEPTLLDDEVIAAIESLTQLAPLHNGSQNTLALGYIGHGGTLTVPGMLFVNRCTWAHILDETARVLRLPRAELLTSLELAALDGRSSPEGVII